MNNRNPFIRYRHLLDSYHSAMDRGWSDARFVELVERLDESVAVVEGHGFAMTPLTLERTLAESVGVDGGIWVKDDTGNVGGSHKSRHLFGVMLHQHLELPDSPAELAIASCGNAAIAAATVARADQRRLRVFIPTWADQTVVRQLEQLGATIEVSERVPGESGDPTYLRFLEAVESGAEPFSVQATVTPTTIDGGRTLGWEVAEQLGDSGFSGRIRVLAQVGGGAMASAVARGLTEGVAQGWSDIEPIIHPVQTEACAPLRRAWDLMMAEADGDIESGLKAARQDPERFMWPWDPVGTSIANGVLDDVTYDWLGVVTPTARSGGWPIVVSEENVEAAYSIGRTETGIDVSATGTAGLAGLIDARRSPVQYGEAALVLFTGIERNQAASTG